MLSVQNQVAYLSIGMILHKICTKRGHIIMFSNVWKWNGFKEEI